MIMQSIDLLADHPDPDEAQIRHGIEGNLCRCTGYQNIIRAIRQASEQMRPGAGPDAERIDETATQPVGGE